MSDYSDTFSAGSAERAQIRLLKASGRWREALRHAGRSIGQCGGRSPESMYALVWRTYQPCVTVASVAHEAHVSERALVRWRGLAHQGALAALAAGENLVGASELAAARAEIGRLESALGRMVLNERRTPLRASRLRSTTRNERKRLRLDALEVFVKKRARVHPIPTVDGTSAR